MIGVGEVAAFMRHASLTADHDIKQDAHDSAIRQTPEWSYR